MDILKDIDNTHNYSKKVFKDFDGEEKEYLDKFAFMASLGYEIYLKKKLLEHMVDTYFVEEEAEKPQKEAKKPNRPVLIPIIGICLLPTLLATSRKGPSPPMQNTKSASN
jgi:hypothetical protein